MSLGLLLRQHPVVALPTTADGGEWTASFTVVLVESGGVSGTIHSVQASVVPRPEKALVRGGGRRPTALAEARPERGRVPARGAVEIGLTVRYAFTTGAREAVAEVSVIVAGHDGYHYRVAERFPIV